MKHSVIYIISISAILSILTAETMSDNGRAGAVGSPGETTCNTSQCHNSFPANTGGGSVRAESSMNNWTYDPLTTYYMSITVAKSGVGLFGVGAEILTSSNTNAGSIIVTDPAHTTIKSAIVGGVSRKSLVHKLNGGASQDSMVFNFSWTSPDTTAGPLTMYFSGNATNANNAVTGDYIYTATQVILPASPNHVSDIITIDAFSVFPNPAEENITIHYTLQKNENVIALLYNVKGQVTNRLFDELKSAGAHNDKIALPDNFSPGIYYLSLECASGKLSRKILVK
jgi:hypothetical protein